jgi:chromosome segregation ATPase
MSTIQGLRTLVKLKQRRLGQLDDAVKAAQQHLRGQVSSLGQVLDEEKNCRAQEEAQRDKLFNTSSNKQGFRASDIVTLQHLLSDATLRTTAVTKRVAQAEQQVEAARQQVRSAQQALQRGEQQLDKCRQRLKAAMDEIERSQEDQQDEESEEASVARMLAAVRSQAVADSLAA